MEKDHLFPEFTMIVSISSQMKAAIFAQVKKGIGLNWLSVRKDVHTPTWQACCTMWLKLNEIPAKYQNSVSQEAEVLPNLCLELVNKTVSHEVLHEELNQRHQAQRLVKFHPDFSGRRKQIAIQSDKEKIAPAMMLWFQLVQLKDFLFKAQYCNGDSSNI